MKRTLLDVASEVCGFIKGKSGILKRIGGIKIWMWLCVDREGVI